jgi:acetoin utilization protein AcuC
VTGTCVYLGEQLARYGFGGQHPFGTDRLAAFRREFERRGLDRRATVMAPHRATLDDLALFHTPEYLDLLARKSETGEGYLDDGDTPAFPGMLEAARYVAGSSLDAVERLMSGSCRRAFVPIGGLHHARPGRAAGFCVINDCGIAIETLKRRHGLTRIAYVDLDAHHGDGVFYTYEADPAVIGVDFHEDGDYLYPGTGRIGETGKGPAKGRKLNIPLPPGGDDALFLQLWPRAEIFLERFAPQIILLQAGADSLGGDPITHLELTPAAHAHAAAALCRLAERHCDGRVLAFGGGGYDRTNLAKAWCAVVEAFLESGPNDPI